MGQRERKRRKEPVAQGARRGPDYSASRAKDDAVRAELKPLQPGERPPALVIAAVFAGLIGLANLVLYAAGLEIDGDRPPIFGTLLFCVLMLAAAAGMWRLRYWAVLGFQALLAFSVLIAALALLRAETLYAAALCLAIIGGGGLLFYKLIRVLARIQMPQRHAS